MEPRDLSVVIATQGGAEMLPMALAHLEVQTHPAARFEILVVDYGENDASREVLERYAAGTPVRTRCFSLPNGDFARARNLGALEAKGRLLLFLDPDLLAGPGLVEAHVKAMESRERQAVRGRVQVHPQVNGQVFSVRLQRRAEPAPATALEPADWSFDNLSLPRDVFLESGGFHEGLGFDGLQDAELAWRLHHEGISAVYAREAAAFVWRSTRLCDERQRQYLNGYSLYRLIQEGKAEELRQYTPPPESASRVYVEKLMQPLYRRLCDPLAQDTRTFSLLCGRILQHDFNRGYRDAAAQRPPKFEGKSLLKAVPPPEARSALP